MPSVISAGTTAGTAITVSGDTTGNLAFQTQAGANTITVPNITGTLITTASTFAGTGPAFSAYHSTTQSLTVDTLTKVSFNTESFDTNNNFASSRFTPTVAGYYQLSCGIRSNNNPIAALHVQLRLNNTSPIAQGSFANTGFSAFMSSCSGLVYLNGSTDYVEVYSYTATNPTTIEAGIGVAYFQGVMVRAA